MPFKKILILVNTFTKPSLIMIFDNEREFPGGINTAAYFCLDKLSVKRVE